MDSRSFIMAGYVDWSVFTLKELREYAIRMFSITPDMAAGWTKKEMVAMMTESEDAIQASFNKAFEEHVPAEGPASSRAGKLLRAVAWFFQRYFNDGDTLSTARHISPDRFTDAAADQDIWAPYETVKSVSGGERRKAHHRQFVRMIELMFDTVDRVVTILREEAEAVH